MARCSAPSYCAFQLVCPLAAGDSIRADQRTGRNAFNLVGRATRTGARVDGRRVVHCGLLIYAALPLRTRSFPDCTADDVVGRGSLHLVVLDRHAPGWHRSGWLDYRLGGPWSVDAEEHSSRHRTLSVDAARWCVTQLLPAGCTVGRIHGAHRLVRD